MRQQNTSESEASNRYVDWIFPLNGARGARFHESPARNGE
jgi:hypothetical protein